MPPCPALCGACDTDARYKAGARSETCIHGCMSNNLCGVAKPFYKNGGTDCCGCAPSGTDFQAGFKGQPFFHNGCMRGGGGSGGGSGATAVGGPDTGMVVGTVAAAVGLLLLLAAAYCCWCRRKATQPARNNSLANPAPVQVTAEAPPPTYHSPAGSPVRSKRKREGRTGHRYQHKHWDMSQFLTLL